MADVTPADQRQPVATRSPAADDFQGHSRFVLELEFIELLSNPYYIFHLASTPASALAPLSLSIHSPSTETASSPNNHTQTSSLFHQPEFVAYLHYLTYWKQRQYLKFLRHPDTSLRMLELLGSEKFREDVCGPRGWEVLVGVMGEMTTSAATS